jgi:hypothetical protein
MKIFAKLGISLMSVLQKIEKARTIVLLMTGNINFPSPYPTLATITSITNQLDAARLKANSGSKEAATTVHYLEDELDMALKQLAGYVEGIANQNKSTAEEVILSAGMDLRRKYSRSVPEFSAMPTDMPGCVKLVHQGIKRGAHEFQMCTDPSNEANWRTIYMGTSGRFVMTKLTPGVVYYFRARSISKDGPSKWSDVRKVYLILE